jgi:hypothetical protein
MGSELWSHRMICVLLLLLLLLVVGPHILQKVKSAHAHSLYPPPSFFFFLSLRSLQQSYKGIRKTQLSSPAALQEYTKDPTVLSSSPTRVSEGRNRPLQQPYKSIRRTQPSSPAALQEYLKDPTVLYNRPTRESEGPLLSTCTSPTGNPKEPCIVCSSPTGSLKNFVHPSTTALQRES